MSLFSKPILYFVHVLFSLSLWHSSFTTWVTWIIWSNGKWPNSYTDFPKNSIFRTQKFPKNWSDQKKTRKKLGENWAARHRGNNLAGKLFQVTVGGGGLNIISWITMEPEQKLTMFGVLIQFRFSVICVSYVVTCFSSCLRVRLPPNLWLMDLTLPDNIFAPENWWLEYDFPIGEAYFQGRTVSFREGITYISLESLWELIHPKPSVGSTYCSLAFKRLQGLKWGITQWLVVDIWQDYLYYPLVIRIFRHCVQLTPNSLSTSQNGIKFI